MNALFIVYVVASLAGIVYLVRWKPEGEDDERNIKK